MDVVHCTWLSFEVVPPTDIVCIGSMDSTNVLPYRSLRLCNQFLGLYCQNLIIYIAK